MIELDARNPVLQRLIMARLLVKGEPGDTPGGVRKVLHHYLKHRLATSGEQTRLIEACVDLLCEQGHAEKIGRAGARLTEAGRRHVCEDLGLSFPPPSTLRWERVINAYVVPKALGLTLERSDERAKLSQSGRLQGEIVRRAYDLPLDRLPTLSQALNALTWRRLGALMRSDREPPGGAVKDRRIKAFLLSPLLGADRQFDYPTLEKQLPTQAAGARGPGVHALRAALLQRHVIGEDVIPRRPLGDDVPPARSPLLVPPAEPSTAALSPPDADGHLTSPKDFAVQVLQTARHCPTGRSGDDKVLISHVWRHFQQRRPDAGLDLETFKQKLIESHRQKYLTLGEADMADTMAPEDVLQSLTFYLNARFHFVRF